MADAFGRPSLKKQRDAMEASIRWRIEPMPAHAADLERYCPAMTA
ncbi:MAG: hypothetical protein ACK4IS_04225 [Erythrobacter sp.]